MSDPDHEPVPLDYRPPAADAEERSRERTDGFCDALAHPLTPASVVGLCAVLGIFFLRPHGLGICLAPIALLAAFWYLMLRIRRELEVELGYLRVALAIVALVYWVVLTVFPNHGLTLHLWRHYSWQVLGPGTRTAIVFGLILLGLFGVLDLIRLFRYWRSRSDRKGEAPSEP